MNIKTKTGIGMALAVLIAAVVMAAPAAAYPGDHPLTVYEQDTVTGGLIYIVDESGIKGETYRCLLDHENPDKIYYLELTQNLELNLPEGATVKTARLYNYYTWSDPGPTNLTAPGTDAGVPAEAYIQLTTPIETATATSLNPADCTIPNMISCDAGYCPCPNPISFFGSNGGEVLHYWDIKEDYSHKSPKYGWRWRFPGGTIAWDVTDLVAASGTGTYTATIMNAKPDTLDPDERFCSYGFALLVIYEKTCEPTIEYWIAEGMDLLYAYGYYGITKEEATTNAMFTGEFYGNAELHTVTSASTTVDKTTVFFNDMDVGTLPTKSKFAVGHDVYDVTGLSNPVNNVAEIEDTLGDYFEVRNFFLVAQVQPIAAGVTIEPETLNLKSNGEWVTAYIELPDGYDVADIELNTVLLDCTIPAENDPQYGFVTNEGSYLMDHDGDGILERMVKFDREAVIAYLGTYDFEGDTGNHRVADISVTGKVADTPFGGSDTVRVLH